MTVESDEALALLWDLSGLCEETQRFEGKDAMLAHWLLSGEQCRRAIKLVAAAGRTRELPPALRQHREFFNRHDWRIPE